MGSEQEIFDGLAELCTSPGYAHAIAYLSFRDNVVGYGAELKAEDYAKLFSSERIIRTELSTLIGLMLRAPRDLSIPAPEKLQGYIERTETLLKELHDAMNRPMRDQLKAGIADPGSAPEADPFRTAAAMREPIFYGAESAYSFQYVEFSERKYARDERWLRTNKGFSPEEGKRVVRAICAFLNENILAALNALRNLAQERWTLLDGFTFSTAEIAAKSGLPDETVTTVVSAFSFPDDGNPTFTSLHAFNAANAYPIIKRDDVSWMLFQYVSLSEALYETPFYWMAADKSYMPTAMAHRGLFTEEYTSERLEGVFGAENVFRNVDIWETSAKKRRLGEIDVLVMYGSRAIIAQAKSKRLTLESRKGNDLQLQSDFKNAVQDAYDQAYACGQHLISGLGFFVDATGQVIQIPKRIKHVHPICVVSDHYPALSFQARQFLKVNPAGEIKSPLVCDVFLIDVVTEFLDTPLRCLSYLDLRAKAGDNVMLSHEITALGFHLKNNLWLGEYDFVLLEDDISADVDIAMAGRREGVPGQKTPPGILTELRDTTFGRIIEQIERSSETGAVETGLELLKLSSKSARDLSLLIDRITTAAADGGEHDVTVTGNPGDGGITVHCNSLPDLAAAPKLKRHCELRKYSQKAGRWCGLAIQPQTAALRFGLALDYPWRHEIKMQEAVAKLSAPLSIKALSERDRVRADERRKIGRNERCPCGSGRKYKHCCLGRDKG